MSDFYTQTTIFDPNIVPSLMTKKELNAQIKAGLKTWKKMQPPPSGFNLLGAVAIGALVVVGVGAIAGAMATTPAALGGVQAAALPAASSAASAGTISSIASSVGSTIASAQSLSSTIATVGAGAKLLGVEGAGDILKTSRALSNLPEPERLLETANLIESGDFSNQIETALKNELKYQAGKELNYQAEKALQEQIKREQANYAEWLRREALRQQNTQRTATGEINAANQIAADEEKESGLNVLAAIGVPVSLFLLERFT